MQIEFLLGFVLGSIIVGGFAFFFFKGKLQAKESELLLAKLQVEQTQSLSQQMSEKFELLASRIFDEKTAKFQDQSIQNLTFLLDPFKERLKDFEKKVEESYSTERTERGSLRGELSKLIELNLKMSTEAESLTRALRGDNKTQGAWGELVLENILEKSGLRKGEEYTVQATDFSLRNEDGQPIRPDVIIHLPDDKHIIVDSKVSMTAYDAYMSSMKQEDQDKWAKAHTDSIKRHVDGLANKKYHTADKLTTTDFVILFIPLESSFALAMKYRPELQQEAWEKRIAIVSPTTLLVTLKMVAALWKTERQEKNALEIAKKGGMLYDKFVGLVTDLEGLGKKLDDAQKAHGQVMNKMKEGRGNLFNQVETLRELGAKAEKKLQITDSQLIED